MHKNILKISSLVVVVLAVGFNHANAQPTQSPGVGSGAISSDGSGNLGIGTSTAKSGSRFTIYASSSGSTFYGLQILQPNGGAILSARGDGRVGIGTLLPNYPLTVAGNIEASGGTFIGNLAASNLTSGVFGAGNFAFPSSLGISTSSQVGLPQKLSVYGSGYMSGSLGLGTPSPEQKLEVQANGGSAGIGIKIINTGTATNDDVFIKYNTQSSRTAFQGINRDTGMFTIAGVNGFSNSQDWLNLDLITGNVGIGTTGPGANLHISADENASVEHNDAQIRISGTTNSAKRLNVGFDTTDNYGFIQAVESLVAGRNLVLNPHGGNVGIGTTGPGYKLDVQGGQINSSGGLCIAGDCRTSWSAVGGSSPWTRSSTFVILATTTDSVGIGTASPISKLQTTGNLTIGVGTTAGTVGNVQITTGGASPIANRLTYGTDGSGWKFAIAKNQGGTVTEQITIQDNGNVGIGTTTPSNKLHVSGNLGVTGWIGAGCEVACESSGGYSIFNENGLLDLYNGTTLTRIRPWTGSYTNTQIMGSKNSYSGINFADVTGAGRQLMVHNTSDIQGFYSEGSGAWSWYFQGGILSLGGVNTGGTVTAAEIYSNGWFRNNNNSTGLYNQVSGNHLYSETGYWTMNTGTTGGIRLRNGFGGVGRGNVYHDASYFGLLNNAESWALQIPHGTTNVNVIGTLTVGGGTGKINVGTVDPIYTIEGKKYATYLPAMTGQKEETTGVLDLMPDEEGNWMAEIDFRNQEEASDIWLFTKITDLQSQFDKMMVLLTPSFNGNTWYERDVENMKLIIHGEYGGEVSYRLTATRFDAADWGNRADKEEAEGFNLDKLLGR